MKRQIIKTRPQRPYAIARVFLFVIALLLLAVLVYLWWSHAHARAGALSVTRLLQDLIGTPMNPRSPAILS